ncbi:hypothetical protein M2164_003906 [Streptomyces sp. SAI-208]|jgi:hypothetical protein|uniref:DUF4232 domain-containing protein n=1 Tax=unclassified Streptomyces TaxID=2593676 RepID=UPI00247616CB|nr:MULTISPECIES: DUF4232 domain-containing protein [unclassified Streptomyces]MDH6549675.1 hypothetical protein [Streptomyces sp. SAI-041]MDH6586319.1 hypothetical protein [Streptomyces sp. SAI-133]MDH6608271.1 hypothetical protein [Streptomyces sp. SAI-208]
MRAAPLAVTAFAAALLLTGCSGDSDSSGGDKSTASPSNGTTCRIGAMDVEVGPASVAPAAGDTGNIPVTFTNQSAECTLDGFPGIDLNAADSSASLSPTEGSTPTKLTLAKGTAATVTLTYTRGEAGAEASLDVKTLEIGLPGADTRKSFKWSYGPVQGQGGNAGDPTASFTAFTQAGD